MATIECPGCKAPLSVKGLVHCPLCRSYLNPPHHSADLGQPEGRKTLGWRELAGATALTGIVASVLAIIYSVAFPSDEKIKHGRVAAALAQCQNAIRATAQYGEGELPPYTPNHSNGDEFYFAWPTGSFHFANGFGAKVNMSASCIGVVSTGEIQHLTINGNDIR